MFDLIANFVVTAIVHRGTIAFSVLDNDGVNARPCGLCHDRCKVMPNTPKQKATIPIGYSGREKARLTNPDIYFKEELEK